MAWGYFQKMVIADRLSLMLVDPVFSNIQAYSGGVLALAAVAFCLQIYCDFSGYSDIARGCAKMLGIDLMVNFRGAPPGRVGNGVLAEMAHLPH